MADKLPYQALYEALCEMNAPSPDYLAGWRDALEAAAKLTNEMEDEWWKQPPGVSFTASDFIQLTRNIRALKETPR